MGPRSGAGSRRRPAGLGCVWGALHMAALCTHAADNHPHAPAGGLAHRPPAAGGREFPAALLTPLLATPSMEDGEGHRFQGHTPQRQTLGQETETGIGAKAARSRPFVDRGAQTGPVSTFTEQPQRAKQRAAA